MNILTSIPNIICRKIHNIFKKEEKIIIIDEKVEQKKEHVIIHEKHRRAKVNNHTAYHYYTAKNRQYFKTLRGKRPIKITATEAILIIQYLKQDFSTEDIYENINFYHNIRIPTLKQWITQYNKGLMDLSISWICDNHIDNISVDKNAIRKNKR